MKTIKKLGVLLILLSITSIGVNSQTVPNGCIRCTNGNNGWCLGNNVKACLDEVQILANKCLIGASKLSDCPPVNPE